MSRPAHRLPITDQPSPFTALLPLLLAACCSYGFLGFGERPAAVGNEFFAQGKYDEAINKYGEALVDDPDSPALNFNMGDAHYKAGNYTDALSSFSRVRAATDSEREARVAYNVGNVKFRMAASTEAEKPQESLEGYAEALAAYRRALGIDAGDEDAKFNYEFTVKRIKELEERIERERQQQEQQEQQDQQDQQEQQPQDQQQAEDQPQQEGEEQQEQQAQQDQGEQPQEQQPQQEQEQQAQEQEQQQQVEQQREPGTREAQASAGEEDADADDMAKREASALVEAARDDELRPEDFIRRAQGGALVQPAQDW